MRLSKQRNEGKVESYSGCWDFLKILSEQRINSVSSYIVVGKRKIFPTWDRIKWLLKSAKTPSKRLSQLIITSRLSSCESLN